MPAGMNGRIVGYAKNSAQPGEAFDVVLVTPDEIIGEAERILKDGNE
jgi:hypothetical protein